jgi:hypothetical protein
MAVRLQFEGIRCFVKPQSAVVRPLTLLVGENSSGKSTFLALCQAASCIARREAMETSFNKPPFALGAYDQIASYKKRGEHAGRFSIALSADGPIPASVQAEFAPRDGQPFLEKWQLTSGDQYWRLTFDQGRNDPLVETPGRSSRMSDGPGLPGDFLVMWFVNPPDQSDHLTNALTAIQSVNREFAEKTYAFAPIRTNPRRTYDPIRQEPEPEGSHVPILLARLSRPGGNGQWAQVTSALRGFGTESGLFERIEVIRKGKGESDPFQIGVKTLGPAFNLIDVGYGVSQALPILVDTVLQPEDVMFLLQQPEVHLHPRAQAELGSFFAHQVARKHRFVIETHSDHLIDRVRMEVRRGTLKPDQVSLLYFERQKQGATIHNIDIGPDGAIIDPPPGYRRFFFDEENRLLDI